MKMLGQKRKANSLTNAANWPLKSQENARKFVS